MNKTIGENSIGLKQTSPNKASLKYPKDPIFRSEKRFGDYLFLRIQYKNQALVKAKRKAFIALNR